MPPLLPDQISIFGIVTGVVSVAGLAYVAYDRLRASKRDAEIIVVRQPSGHFSGLSVNVEITNTGNVDIFPNYGKIKLASEKDPIAGSLNARGITQRKNTLELVPDETGYYSIMIGREPGYESGKDYSRVIEYVEMIDGRGNSYKSKRYPVSPPEGAG